MPPVPREDPTVDSDSDVEFEDVPIQPSQPQPKIPSSLDQPSEHAESVSANIPWTPELHIPEQRETPVASGSDAERQLRGRLSMAIDRINTRQMKARIGMDATNTQAGLTRYTSIQQLADDIEGTADMLWESATPSIQVEGLITLAGILERSLKTYNFDPIPTLALLNKLDYYFIALMQGEHPASHHKLPGASPHHPLVTQTQKVRIRSIAEITRTNLFAMMPGPREDEMNEDDDDADQKDDWDEPEMPVWMMQASKVYERVLMLLGDQGDPNETGGFNEFD
ncbi:hypothetical protein N7539_006926 [Penicillium diatomitis]|uniref:Uncharacterized protein n=1 Tax=Penicillium diatomitis TaxID=2819901 RepID=A0A9W9X2T3_9EURO|nr:uncharacterized protein N7539_006926 [Penicillium diatomitis]KAJ5481032.1 hypothetical protein N7539_006926 [Penicillium diatomitis]